MRKNSFCSTTTTTTETSTTKKPKRGPIISPNAPMAGMAAGAEQQRLQVQVQRQEVQKQQQILKLIYFHGLVLVCWV